MPLITDSTALDLLCTKLSSLPFIAIDTEFLRDKYYYPKLCLIQIGTEDNQYLIDPLAPNIDLSPLITLFTNPNVIKVFHSAKQDIETFYHLTGNIISPLADTQIIAMAIGYFSQTSYATLVSDFLGTSLDKTEQFSQWDRRPLSDNQLRYASADVLYLYKLYPLLQQKLIEKNRTTWIEDDIAELSDPSMYITLPERAWERLSLRDRSPLFLATVKALAAWREYTAQEANRPRTHILKDSTLIDIASARPKSISALQRIRQTSHLSPLQQQSIIDVIQKYKEYPTQSTIEPMPILSPDDKYILDMFKILLYAVSKEHLIAERLLASSQDLVTLVINPKADIPAFSGWRYEIFGKYLKDLQTGTLALRINHGKVEFL